MGLVYYAIWDLDLSECTARRFVEYSMPMAYWPQGTCIVSEIKKVWRQQSSLGSQFPR
jgi:hypothetical protein